MHLWKEWKIDSWVEVSLLQTLFEWENVSGVFTFKFLPDMLDFCTFIVTYIFSLLPLADYLCALFPLYFLTFSSMKFIAYQNKIKTNNSGEVKCNMRLILWVAVRHCSCLALVHMHIQSNTHVHKIMNVREREREEGGNITCLHCYVFKHWKNCLHILMMSAQPQLYLNQAK